jgi:O-antigen/teichoic acid export membrane protein
MGYYNAASQWFSALLFLPGVIGQAAIPVLSEQIGKKDHERAKKILVSSIKLNMAIIFPIAILGSLCSPWIMLLYGKDFGAAWPTLVVTLIAAAITAVQSPAAQVMTSSGNMWKAAIMNVSWALSFVVLSKLLLPWGSFGLSAARSLAYLIYALWSIKFAFSLIGHLKNQSVNESINCEVTCSEH